MKTLDKRRAFGEICGAHAGFPGARYEQDGLFFGENGNILPGQIAGVTETIELPEDAERTEEDRRMVADDQNLVESQALDLYRDGKNKREIRKLTGLHHKKIEKIIRDEETRTE